MLPSRTSANIADTTGALTSAVTVCSAFGNPCATLGRNTAFAPFSRAWNFDAKIERGLSGLMYDVRSKHPLLACLLAVIAAVCLHGVAPAQISPGPLAGAHQSLNGSANCTTCHALGRERTFKCLECHAEIASRVAAHKGLHATYNIQPGSSQGCPTCHSDHNGEDFPLIKWDTKNFNHALSGFKLEGKHAGLSCNQCHTAEKIPPAQRANLKIKDLNRTFLGLSQSCVSCHQDAHQGRLGNNCAQCHNSTDWKTVSPQQFDHSKTRYALTGMHMQVTCEKCHTPGPDNKPRYSGIPFGQCSDCHRDPHHGAFTQTCQSCHNTSGWKKLAAGLNEKFDHSKTKFPLLGKHAAVGCIQCHGSGDFKKPIAFGKCADCHKPDPHKAQFAKRPDGGECAGCHTVAGWKPSTFTVTNHATTAYPLQGAHARVGCQKCHIPRGSDTVFKMKFEHCTDCHEDKHSGQFAAAPYFNGCERCHTVETYRPSTFSLARHKETRFLLTGEHIAVPCADCHKQSTDLKPPTAIYHWANLSCTSCHADPHRGQFNQRMQQAKAAGAPGGCETCHSTKSWKELSKFDHSKTGFPLLGSHRATACIDCHKPPNLETNMMHVDFKAAPKRCEQCHDDPHGKQFARGDVTPCAECHNSAKWKPSLFDHNRRTAFPLQGVHANVKCADCHKLTRQFEGKPVLFYKPTPKECAACHGAEKVS
jgi:hypothetical protein